MLRFGATVTYPWIDYCRVFHFYRIFTKILVWTWSTLSLQPTQLLRGQTQDVKGILTSLTRFQHLCSSSNLWYPFLLSKLEELCWCQGWANWKLNCPLSYLLQFHIPLWPLQPRVITDLLQPELDTFCKDTAISTLLMICDGCPCQSASMQSSLE